MRPPLQSSGPGEDLRKMDSFDLNLPVQGLSDAELKEFATKGSRRQGRKKTDGGM